MAHLIEYTVFVHDSAGAPLTLWKGTDRAAGRAKVQELEQVIAADREVFIEESVLRVDIKQMVTNIMGSSMGDLELADVRASRTRLGQVGRFHVLRRKAYSDVPAGEALAILTHRGSSDYQWELTKEGFNYMLENMHITEQCVVDWVRNAIKDASTLYERPREV